MGRYYEIARLWNTVDVERAKDFKNKLGELLHSSVPMEVSCTNQWNDVNVSVLNNDGTLREITIDKDDIFDLLPTPPTRVRPGAKK